MNIVSIGGGTGLSTLLSGLKGFVGRESHPEEEAFSDWIEKLTAVVTVTDDGGSSGRLREEFQILPPGDIRNCMVALAEDEHLLTKLFQYRFESDGDLSGHSFGNLFLAALAGVTGDFLEALKMTSEVLAIKGRIFPSTVEDVTLVAELEDGRVIQGETKIVASRARVKRLSLSCEPCRPLPETLEALREADLITLGPGSLYTSIVPNLLVDDIVDTMCESDALKVYICNIMTQPGETEGFFVEDHLRVLFEYSPQLKLDYIVVNSAPITPALREKYLADGSVQVEFQSEPTPSMGLSPQVVSSFDRMTAPRFQIINGDLLNEHDVVRHDPHKLARLLFDIYEMDRVKSRRSVGVR
ncbi:MAG TPA: gluconeogenesis factor YvcK family protein [Blastocatellia bacterium]|nr:gluconeogenesis factor YvcK family protein [Blastocatellia bacterium]